MQSVSSSIWTRVAVFISYDDNNNTMGTSTNSLFISPLCAHIVFERSIDGEWHDPSISNLYGWDGLLEKVAGVSTTQRHDKLCVNN